MKQHKILEEHFGVKREDILENMNKRRTKKVDKKNGFATSDTWGLDYSFVCWLAERVYRYKEIGGQAINLEYHKFKYNDQEYTQAELIDVLLKKCKEWLEVQIWDDKADPLLREICDIWKELLPAMWW